MAWHDVDATMVRLGAGTFGTDSAFGLLFRNTTASGPNIRTTGMQLHVAYLGGSFYDSCYLACRERLIVLPVLRYDRDLVITGKLRGLGGT
jgi:hypothetical protein